MLVFLTAACGKSASYEEGFRAGQRLATMGIDNDAACKAAFVLSSASDRTEYLEGCADGLVS